MATITQRSSIQQGQDANASGGNDQITLTGVVSGATLLIVGNFYNGQGDVNLTIADDRSSTWTIERSFSNPRNQTIFRAWVHNVPSGTFVIDLTDPQTNPGWYGWIAYEYDGFDNAVSSAGAFGNGNGTSATAGSITGDDYSVGHMSHGNSDQALATTGTNFSQIDEQESTSSGQPLNIADNTSGGTQTTAHSIAATSAWMASVFTFADAAAGGGPAFVAQAVLL